MLAVRLAAETVEKELRVLPEPAELLLASIAFLLLVGLLQRFVFPKLKHALEERARKIQGQLEEAERTRREADDILEQYRAQLAGARTDVQRIIDEGKRTAETVRAELVRKAEQDAAEIVARARQEVSGERDRAMAELRSTVGDLSIELASKVIEQELSSSKAARALVDQAISRLAQGNGHN